MPGTVLISLPALPKLTLIITCQDGYYSYPLFTDKKAEAQSD